MKKPSSDAVGKFFIAVATCGISFLTFGTARLSGQLYPACRERFRVGREEASLPFITCYTVRNLIGPFVGYLGNKFGLRCVTLSGCLLAAISVFACFFVEDIVPFTVLWGAGYGAGFGLGSILIPNVLQLHFKKNFNKVYGFFIGFGCVGSFILPGIAEVLLKTYGLSGTFLVVSALLLHCVPAAMLLKVPETNRKAKNQSEVKEMDQPKSMENRNDSRSTPQKDTPTIVSKTYDNKNAEMVNLPSELTVPECSEIETHRNKNWATVTFNSPKERNEIDVSNRYPEVTESHIPSNISKEQEVKELSDNITIKYSLLTEIQGSEGEKQKVIQAHIDSKEKDSDTMEGIDEREEKVKFQSNSLLHHLKVFLDPAYILILVSLSIAIVAVTVQYTVIVDACRDKGITEDVTVLMTFAITDMLGRFLVGFVADAGCISQLHIFTLCFGSVGLLFIVFTWLKNFYIVLLSVAGFGTVMGVLVAMPVGIITNYMEKEKLVMAFSSRYVLFGILNFSQPPIIGYFRETLHSYDGLFYLLGSTCLLGTFIALFIPSAARWRDKRNRVRNIKKKTCGWFIR